MHPEWQEVTPQSGAHFFSIDPGVTSWHDPEQHVGPPSVHGSPLATQSEQTLPSHLPEQHSPAAAHGAGASLHVMHVKRPGSQRLPQHWLSSEQSTRSGAPAMKSTTAKVLLFLPNESTEAAWLKAANRKSRA